MLPSSFAGASVTRTDNYGTNDEQVCFFRLSTLLLHKVTVYASNHLPSVFLYLFFPLFFRPPSLATG